MALAVALLWFPVSAHAGTYDVVSCNAPGGDGINRSWVPTTYNSAGRTPPLASLFVVPTDVSACPTVSGLRIGGSPANRTVKADDGIGYVFTAPPGTAVRDVSLWRFGQARTSSAAATTPYWTALGRAGVAPGGPVTLGSVPNTDFCLGSAATYPAYCSVGAPGFSAASGTTYTAINEPVISWGFQCVGASSAVTCLTGDGANANVAILFQGAKVTVEDLTPPDVSLATLAGWLQPGTPQTVSATDVTGIGDLRVLLDGAERVAAPQTCDFHLPSPCPAAPAQGFDFQGVADGVHLLAVVAKDAAGNVTRTERTVSLDGTPPVVNLVSLSGRTIKFSAADATSGLRSATIEVRSKRTGPFTALATTLSGGRLTATVPRSKLASAYGVRASVTDNAGNVRSALATSMDVTLRVGKHARSLRDGRVALPYGRAGTVTGRITTSDGAQLAGRIVFASSQTRQTGATAQPLPAVTTDVAGRFAIPLAAGPSRIVTVSYLGDPTTLSRARTLEVRVPARATIHASSVVVRGAASVRFSGRLELLGTSLPPGGKLVDLQAAANGHWSTVATTRAIGAGAGWHAVAHFRGTPGRFPVRLRIRREAAFPYDLGYSPAVVVRVR